MTLLDLLLQLLPHGPYSREPDATHLLELGAVAAVFEAADQDLDNLESEVFPATATAVLEDWERVLDLHPASGSTTAQRRSAILALLRLQPSLSPGYIEDVVGTMAGASADVVETSPVYYDDATYDESSYVDELVFEFLVVLDRLEFGASGVALASVQLLVDRIKPAHTRGTVCTSDARYDDPISLYDTCVFGV